VVQAGALHAEPLDGPTWCGQQITDFTGLIASWQEQGVACAGLQRLLHAELERWTTMAEQPDGKTSEGLPTRRIVLAGLATLSAPLLAKVQAGPLTALLVEEFLSQCSASITACWHLLNGDGLVTVEYALPTYLPLLVALARQPSRYQQTVAYLASQGSLLMALISYHRLRFRAELAYSKQAVELAKLSADRNLFVGALIFLGSPFDLNGQPEIMLQVRQEAVQYLNEEVAVPLHSKAYGHLAYAYARNGQVQDALRCMGQARDLFLTEFGEVPPLVSSDYSLSQLILFEGRTHLALGKSDAEHVHHHSQQAKSALAQIGQLPSTIIVPERYRIQIINEQAVAAVGAGNMEEFLHYLLAGVEGAKALGSEKRRQEALANWRAARAKWPHEAQVKELAEVFLL
jgi:tetratricopeptide (TPR) repeat protein